MRVLSLFDGISCGRVALERAGIHVDAYHASEIDKYATQISQKNYPDIIRHGDINSIDFKQFKGKIDFLPGGSPCQDLSIAKQNRQGLRGERSGLFWKYVEGLEIIRPEHFLLENVASMHNDDRDAITETLMKLYPNVECIMINSALVSAQQRKRYYWTNWKNEQPVDKGIFLKDIIESGQAFDEKTYCLTHEYAKKTTSDYLKKRASFVAKPIGCALRTWPRLNKKALNASKDQNAGQTEKQMLSHWLKPIVWYAIEVIDGKTEIKGVACNIKLPDGFYIIRKLTPTECERLQTLPDGYTEGVSNTQRYKMLGNGWTVDVIAHILKGIKQ